MRSVVAGSVFRTLGVVVVSLAVTGHAETVTFDVNGKRNIECLCVAATSGCQLKVFDALAGSQRHTWVYEISTRKGATVDLTEICYRKRDVEKLGDGLCCEASDPGESMKRFFSGKLQK